MIRDDLRKIFLGSTLFRLDTILATRLIPILYASGLGALLLWAVTHLFATFGRTFGDGLWGLLEIVVFGLLWLVVLRLVCEALLVFFKTHEMATKAVALSRMPSSLADDVSDAISDIATEEDDFAPEDKTPEVPPTPVRRTAKRAPPSPKVEI